VRILKPSHRRMQAAHSRNTRHGCVMTRPALVPKPGNWATSPAFLAVYQVRARGTTPLSIAFLLSIPDHHMVCATLRQVRHCNSLTQFYTLSVTTLPQLRVLFLPCHALHMVFLVVESREHLIARAPPQVFCVRSGWSIRTREEAGEIAGRGHSNSLSFIVQFRVMTGFKPDIGICLLQHGD
jgi:hypothetical protein